MAIISRRQYTDLFGPTSGDKVRIVHPDYVFYSQKQGRIFYFPQDEHSIFEMILPKQIAKVRAKVKKSAA